MKKLLSLFLLLTTVSFVATGCGTKTLYCDGCNAELKVAKSSNMDEDWIVFCKDCEEELFGDSPIVEESN